MAGLCYVMPVTGHKAYTGKEEEEDIFMAMNSFTPPFYEAKFCGVPSCV
jgi:hypothetical protein